MRNRVWVNGIGIGLCTVTVLLVMASSCARAPSSATPEAPAPTATPAAAAPPAPVGSPTSAAATSAAEDPAVAVWCKDARDGFRSLHWEDTDPCPAAVKWQVGGKSVDGRPLVYAEFGDPASPNTTLIMTMVHGDEITPFYLGIEVSHLMIKNAAQYAKAHVVVVPLVNPDGFYRTPRTRMNARGVDVNRNFPTNDWDAHALKAWKIRFRSDPRRYPGPTAGSEPETVFQEELIRKFKPQKILSVHAPLNHLDYDGPNPLSLKTFSREYVLECLKLRKQLKAISAGFYPGSLGNFAGFELGIPTLTLELPTANPRKALPYWVQFKAGIKTMIEFAVPPPYALGVGHTAPES